MKETPFAVLTADKLKLTNQVNEEGSNPVEGIMCGSGPQESPPQGTKPTKEPLALTSHMMKSMERIVLG